MNSSDHEEFEMLCALSTSGELTEREWHRLDEHLAGCASCRLALTEYEQLAHDVMPTLAAAAHPSLQGETADSLISLDGAERRLMDKLDEKPRASPEVLLAASRRRWIAPLALMTAASVTLVFLGYVQPEIKIRKTATVRPPQGAPSGSLVFSGAGQMDPDTSLREELRRTNAEVTRIQTKIREEAQALNQAQTKLRSAGERLDSAQAAVEQGAAERKALKQQLVSEREEAQSLRAEQTLSRDAAVQRDQQVVVLENRVRSLTATLDQKDHVLAEDRELLAHDRDIRDLIGARNLYMAEIYDVAQSGVTKKPFGRVFYTKDKSLIFYGYDLDQQPGLKKSVTFQAWGKSDSDQNVNLGLFYQEESKKRWVLKFNDANTLARLNSVFVTAEPAGGSSKPTGKQVLTTYLRLEPNHP